MSHPLADSGGSAARAPRPARALMSPRISVKPTIAFAVSGLIVFAITGLFGYVAGPGPYLGLDFSTPLLFLDTLFRKPWLLFGWLCALIFTFQAAILRQQPLTEQRRRQQRWTYAVTGVCIILVALIDIAGPSILRELANFIDWIGQIINAHGVLFQVIASPWFYTLVNFAIIAWLAVRAMQRAIRLRTERLRLSAACEAASPDEQSVIQKRLDQLPEMHELIIGDLLVRSVIVLLLSVVVRYELLSFLNLIPQPPKGDNLPPFNACSVALPGSRCPPPYTDTLSFCDLIIALFGLTGGVALAAIFAQSAAQAEADQTTGPEATAADHALAGAGSLDTDPPVPNPDGDLPPVQARSFGRLGHAVAGRLLDILIRPFEPVGSGQDGEPSPYDPLAIVRTLAWPLLILGGTAAAGGLARETAWALHHLLFSTLTPRPGVFGFITLPTIPLPTVSAYHPDRLVHEVLAVVMGLLALAGIIGSAWVLTRDRRVRLAGLAFVKENGVTTLILYCAYSFALWLFQLLLSTLRSTLLSALFSKPDPYQRLQAFNPGFLTIASLALLLWFGLPILWKRVGTNPPRTRPT